MGRQDVKSKEKFYTIYVHINKYNLKVYVGQTCQDVNRRWRDGKGYTNSETYFKNAINKYGWDGFEHIILETELTKNQADFYEKLYIMTYNSTNRNFGYNETYGGDGVVPSETTRRKMSENHADFRGNKSPMFGKHLKDFMSDNKYETWLSNVRKYAEINRGANNPCAVSVYCPETNTIYGSITEASMLTSTNIEGISNCINGRIKTSGIDIKTGLRLHWCRAEDKDKFYPEFIYDSHLYGKSHPKSKAIYCIELDEVFYSASEANNKYKIPHSHISDCLIGKRHSCGKHPMTNKPLHWCYLEDKETFIANPDEETLNLGKYHHNAKSVYCIELNEVFDTATEASRKYGFPKSHIGAVCRGERNSCGTHPETNEKLHWMFLPDAINKGLCKA